MSNNFVSKKVKVTSEYVEANFDIKVGTILDTVQSPKDKTHLDGVWVYCESRKEPLRLLPKAPRFPAEYEFVGD